MTEFGRTSKELDELSEKYGKLDPSIIITAGRETINKTSIELRSVIENLTTGGIATKAAKFKSKAEAPPDTRLYGAAMVEKVMIFLEKQTNLLNSLQETEKQLLEWMSVAAAIDIQLSETILMEEVIRSVILFESTDLPNRLPIEQHWITDASIMFSQHSSDVKDTEKRIRNREKKKAKRKLQQMELREAAVKKKERDIEVRNEELEDAFEKLISSAIRKEARGRKEITTSENEVFSTSILTTKGRRTPTPPKTRSPPKSPGRKKTPPKGKRFDKTEIAFEDIPLNLTDPKVEFSIKAIEGTASVLLTSNGVSVTLFKTLLKLEGISIQPNFVIPVELLTDHKAKKKYMKSIEGQKTEQHEDPNNINEDNDNVSDDDILDMDDYDSEDEVERYDEEEEDTVPISTSISFVKNIISGCVVVMVSVGGSFAGGIFSKGECVSHTTFSRYIIRKKQGGRQSNHEGRSDTVGSQMRKRHEIRYKELIIEQLITWAAPISAAAAICLHAPGPMNRIPFYDPVAVPLVRDSSQYALKKTDNRIVGVPFTTHKPTFTEVQRIYKTLFCCKLEFGEES